MHKFSSYITVGVKEDGTRVRKRIYANSQAEFERKKYELKKEYDSIDHPSDITFKEYAKKWLKVYKSSREVATIAMYENCLKKTSHIDNIPLKSIRQTDLQEIIAENSAHPNVCAKIRLLFRQIWGSAMADGILSKDITKRLNLPHREPTEGRSLTKEEITAVKNADLEPMDRMFVQLLFYFGLRPGEALAVMPKDFNLKDNTLTISRAIGYDKNDPYIKSSKTRKVRTIPIPTEFLPILKTYLRKNKGLYLIHRDNHPLTKSSQRKMWERIRKEINRKMGAKGNMDLTSSLHPYVFRHNYCTTCFYNGLSVLKTSELMGNSPQMVMNVYAHLDNSKEPLDSLIKLSM